MCVCVCVFFFNSLVCVNEWTQYRLRLSSSHLLTRTLVWLLSYSIQNMHVLLERRPSNTGFSAGMFIMQHCYYVTCKFYSSMVICLFDTVPFPFLLVLRLFLCVFHFWSVPHTVFVFAQDGLTLTDVYMAVGDVMEKHIDYGCTSHPRFTVEEVCTFSSFCFFASIVRQWFWSDSLSYFDIFSSFEIHTTGRRRSLFFRILGMRCLQLQGSVYLNLVNAHNAPRGYHSPHSRSNL